MAMDALPRSSAPWLFAACLALGLAGPARAAAPDAGADGGGGACVRAWGEARYGAMGYDHLVHVKNECKVAMRCDVSTDVNPEPVTVTVAAGDEVEVLTFRGSPAREFVPKAECKEAK